MSKKLTFDEVKYFIEIESNSGCKLISEEYISANNLLIIKCKCGNDFVASFDKFKSRNKRQCNECGNKMIGEKHKISIDNIHLILKNKGYILLDKYNSNSKKITIKDKEGYYYFTTLKQVIKTDNLVKFGQSNPFTIYNLNHWIIINNKDYILLSEECKNYKDKLVLKCTKSNCQETFEKSIDKILINEGCPFCAGKQVGISNCLATKNPELALEWHPTLNGDLTPYDFTVNSNKKVWWKCLECGHEWPASISNRNNNGRGCPQCNKSKGEKRSKEYLDNNNFVEITQEEYDKLNNFDKKKKVYYISQKEFDGLLGVGNGNLSYDFYLPDYNLLYEYQGQQHEKYIPGFHKSKKEFLIQQEHDRRKREYAKNNNIKLLEIWYWDYDNIEQILQEELNINITNDSDNIVIYL